METSLLRISADGCRVDEAFAGLMRLALQECVVDVCRRRFTKDPADYWQFGGGLFFSCYIALSLLEVQTYLSRSTGAQRLSGVKLSPAQWSALVFVLLNSTEDLDEFELREYDLSEECLLRLLLVVKASRKVDCRHTVEFLRDDSVQVPLFASIVDDASESLYYSYDFDGIVVQLAYVSYITAGLHYLFVGKVDGSKVCNHWHLIKKHLDLQHYSADGVSALRKSVGIVLAFVDGGYFLILTCVPDNPNSAHPMFPE
ncbi:unnamed protein product [Leuciscus chuanchicus]